MKKEKKFFLRIDEETAEILDFLSKKMKITKSEFIRNSIRQAFMDIVKTFSSADISYEYDKRNRIIYRIARFTEPKGKKVFTIKTVFADSKKFSADEFDSLVKQFVKK